MNPLCEVAKGVLYEENIKFFLFLHHQFVKGDFLLFVLIHRNNSCLLLSHTKKKGYLSVTEVHQHFQNNLSSLQFLPSHVPQTLLPPIRYLLISTVPAYFSSFMQFCQLLTCNHLIFGYSAQKPPMETISFNKRKRNILRYISFHLARYSKFLSINSHRCSTQSLLLYGSFGV